MVCWTIIYWEAPDPDPVVLTIDDGDIVVVESRHRAAEIAAAATLAARECGDLDHQFGVRALSYPAPIVA